MKSGRGASAAALGSSGLAAAGRSFAAGSPNEGGRARAAESKARAAEELKARAAKEAKIRVAKEDAERAAAESKARAAKEAAEALVKNPMQNPNIFIKSQKSALQRKEHKETGLSYQGTYEKDFLDYCFDNSISIEKGKRIKYIYDGKEHYYFSDFYYEPKNLIIEIKSDWTYNKYLYINLIKEKSCIDSGYDY